MYTSTTSFLIAFGLLLFASLLQAQSPIVSFPFDNGEDFGDWSNEGNSWRWVSDGTAAGFDATLWNDRPPVRSRSGDGAAAVAGQTGTLTSPSIDLSGESQVFLRFHQYYRALGGSTVVRVRNTSTGGQAFFTVNENVLPQVETGPRAVEVIDITDIAAGGIIEVTFFFESTQYFWIIDDVELYNSFPYPETRPAHYRDTFPSLGYPYAPDDEGWPYALNEIVVQVEPGTPESEVQALRDTLGAVLLDSCVCNTLELWGLGDSVIHNQDGMLYPSGPSIDILERTKGATSSVIIQEADPNYYTVAELQAQAITDNPPLTQNDLANLLDVPADAVRIAILDTGVDFKHESLQPYLYKKADALGNTTDDDSNCAVDDPIGWDFVSDVDISNNPLDDHSHGTHVAGIVAQTLAQACPDNCRFHIVPYKTHDAQGVSRLFQVACATYQAIEDSASVINDSWGFYGSNSGILENAIDSAAINDILVVSAAGNDTLLLDTLQQYPACYTSPNKITVGAFEMDPNDEGCLLAPFSNFSSQWVDILAPGVNITSTIPGGGFGQKSGTSMSTPAVSAAAAIVYCKLGDQATHAAVKGLVLSTADQLGNLSTVATNGRKLNIAELCLTPIRETPETHRITFFPNPTHGKVQVQLPPLGQAADLEIYDLNGRRIGHWTVDPTGAGQAVDVNVSHFPSGMYFLRLQRGRQQWVGRIVKQ